ncbi:hypothetical protein PPERSA_00848 [Pseudocohnilembus persalinus]|uniref:Transmembrane protein n=1 Tax=Pseudocohnilembus persalinus TaxID=266149 RepID=A0A0V0QEK9_PSEPJ|nr:hypothetical protein PPERSA_00848 [Pseudocohnilembus persalinus]|eukprot:KRX00621.1 hypothetical protein PPERSA_00848 [Pseudocohnilembus persalinus]
MTQLTKEEYYKHSKIFAKNSQIGHGNLDMNTSNYLIGKYSSLGLRLFFEFLKCSIIIFAFMSVVSSASIIVNYYGKEIVVSEIGYFQYAAKLALFSFGNQKLQYDDGEQIEYKLFQTMNLKIESCHLVRRYHDTLFLHKKTYEAKKQWKMLEALEQRGGRKKKILEKLFPSIFNELEKAKQYYFKVQKKHNQIIQQKKLQIQHHDDYDSIKALLVFSTVEEKNRALYSFNKLYLNQFCFTNLRCLFKKQRYTLHLRIFGYSIPQVMNDNIFKLYQQGNELPSFLSLDRNFYITIQSKLVICLTRSMQNYYAMRDKLTGKEFSIANAYSTVLNTMFVTLLYSSGMPILIPIETVLLFFQYKVFKKQLIRYSKKYKAQYDQMKERIGLVSYKIEDNPNYSGLISSINSCFYNTEEIGESCFQKSQQNIPKINLPNKLDQQLQGEIQQMIKEKYDENIEIIPENSEEMTERFQKYEKNKIVPINNNNDIKNSNRNSNESNPLQNLQNITELISSSSSKSQTELDKTDIESQNMLQNYKQKILSPMVNKQNNQVVSKENKYKKFPIRKNSCQTNLLKNKTPENLRLNVNHLENEIAQFSGLSTPGVQNSVQNLLKENSSNHSEI